MSTLRGAPHKDGPGRREAGVAATSGTALGTDVYALALAASGGARGGDFALDGDCELGRGVADDAAELVLGF